MGLSVSDVLEIYDEGAPFEGAGGTRYIVPGLKIGEMEIATVSTYDAQGVLLEADGQIAPGDIVRMKQD